MGNQGQVHIEDENVWLYTFFGASELETNVREALRKRWRWNDPSYLARIIFDVMTKGRQGEEQGYGIGGEEADPWFVVIVNCEKQTVTTLKHGKVKTYQSFEDFIN